MKTSEIWRTFFWVSVACFVLLLIKGRTDVACVFIVAQLVCVLGGQISRSEES